MSRHEKALRILKKGTVIPATPLALDDNYKFDEKTARTLMRYYLSCGVGGIATAVHSTQFEIRDKGIDLFEQVLKLVAEEIDYYETQTGNTIVRICGVCGPIEQAVNEAKLALSYGYDAVLLSPGGLNHLSESDMLLRTKAVANEIPVIGFYLQTSVGGVVFSYDYWCKLCEIENVVAIKCASFNRYTTLDVVRAAALSNRSSDITLYTGNDDNIIIDLLTEYKFTVDGKTYKKGFDGGLLGHFCVWTKKVVSIFDELKIEKESGKIDSKWLTLAAEITDTNAVLFDAPNNFRGCIPGIHEVLRRQGLFKNILCLNRSEILSDGQSEEFDRIYKMYPHLFDDDFIKENITKWSDKNYIQNEEKNYEC